MREELYKNLKVSPLPADKYIILQDYEYSYKNYDILVPKGYKTNGADIPRILWSIWPPNRSDYLPAVVLHDYLCDKGEYALAQEVFECSLNELKIHPVTTWCFVTFTTLYLKLKYKY
jgi:hypothetical protein